MATYLQGVTDYIPDYQPFQPDLNFYSNFLQYKQNEYDTNWKSLSNLYGQYFNAELTNPENVKLKDKLLKDIDFNLQRVAGLDLSLEQNVAQATQIFTPFYQDKNLMKDIVYTKNFNNEVASAQGLLKSKDEKVREQYWPTGIEYLMYKREEFAKAKREELVNFTDPKYIPNINGVKLYLKTATDLGISADITQSDGRYFVRKKNGDQLLQPLENIFAATFANDPALQQVYQAQAYVERKRYINQNKNKFQGNEVETEKKYLNDQLSTIREYAKLRDAKNKANTQEVNKQIEKVDEKIKTGQGNQFTEQYQKELQEALQIAQSTESLSDQLMNSLSKTGGNTATTSSMPNVEEDMDVLRFQVEAGTASMLADKDIQLAAYNYSRKGMLIDVKADPYGVAAQNNAYRMQQQQYASQLKREEMKLKKDYDIEVATIKAGLDNGSLLADEKGNVTMNMAAFTPIIMKGKNAAGAATDANTSLIKENHLAFIDQTRQSADPMVRQMVRYMRDAVASGLFSSKEEANKYFFGDKKGGTWSNIDEFWGKYDKHAGGYLYGLNTTKDNKLSRLYARVLQFARAHRGDDDISANFLGSQDHGKFNEYLTLATSMHTINEKNHDAISKNLKSTISLAGLDSKIKNELIDLALQKDNGLLSEKEFIKKGANIYAKFNKNLPFDAKAGNFAQWKTDALKSLNSKQRQQLDNFLKQKEIEISRGPDAGKIKNLQKMGLTDKKYRGLGVQDVKEYTNEFLQKTFGLTPEGIKDDPVKKVKEIYGDLRRAYVDVVQNTKEIMSITPGMGGKANASYSPAEQSWMIYPSIIGTDGFKGWKEMVTRDIGNVNWYDTSKNNISFYGNTISGVKDTKDLYDDPKDLVNISQYVLSKLWSQTGDKKALPFKLNSNQRAMEQRNKGSMTIYPDYKFLKELLQGDGKGMLDEGLIKAIATNGITFITDSKNWNNSVFKSNQYTPLEAAVRALGSVTYEHPMGGGKYKISEDQTGTSPYNIQYSLNQLNPDGTVTTDDFVFPPNTYSLEKLTQEMTEAMSYMSDYNKNTSRDLRSGKFSNR